MADLWGEELAREWKRFHPPSRPSKSELTIYERYIKALSKESVSLLMGSTPDIRDMFAREQKKVYVADWSKHNYNSLKYLMKEKNIENEVFVNQDWRSMTFDIKFDFIIGDLALLVLTRKDSIKVIERISSCLKNDAKTIQRMWTRNHTKPHSLDRIIQSYRSKPPGEDLFSWLELPLLFHIYDYEKEECTAQYCYEVLVEYTKQNKIPKDILEIFEPFKHLNPPLNIPLKNQFEKSLEAYFNIEKIEYGKDCFAVNAPIYILKNIKVLLIPGSA